MAARAARLLHPMRGGRSARCPSRRWRVAALRRRPASRDGRRLRWWARKGRACRTEAASRGNAGPRPAPAPTPRGRRGAVHRRETSRPGRRRRSRHHRSKTNPLALWRHVNIGIRALITARPAPITSSFVRVSSSWRLRFRQATLPDGQTCAAGGGGRSRAKAAFCETGPRLAKPCPAIAEELF